MIKIKFYSFWLSLFVVSGLNSAVDLASVSSSKTDAVLTLQCAGYDVNDVQRKGNQSNGAGFWDAFIKVDGVDSRVIYYGPFEYVKPHFHDIKEIFHITYGSCLVGLFDQATNEWICKQFVKGDTIEIDANIIHCLVAQEMGLCMHVSMDDSTRSVVFVPELEIPSFE